jgi:hypothetical protein
MCAPLVARITARVANRIDPAQYYPSNSVSVINQMLSVITQSALTSIETLFVMRSTYKVTFITTGTYYGRTNKDRRRCAQSFVRCHSAPQ